MILRRPVLRRKPADGAVTSTYEVWVDKVCIGEVVRDDVDEWDHGGARRLWHAFLAGDDEACGDRCLLRRDAVAELLAEWLSRMASNPT